MHIKHPLAPLLQEGETAEGVRVLRSSIAVQEINRKRDESPPPQIDSSSDSCDLEDEEETKRDVQPSTDQLKMRLSLAEPVFAEIVNVFKREPEPAEEQTGRATPEFH